MAGSPDWKVYDPSGEYEGCCKHAEIAAALVAVLGEGATIRYHHGPPLWTEGKEGQSAGESWDHVRDVCHERLAERRRIAAEKRQAAAFASPIMRGKVSP